MEGPTDGGGWGDGRDPRAAEEGNLQPAVFSVLRRVKLSAEAAPRQHSLLPFCLSSLCALL